ncbi:MAG: hypothetical protein ACKV2V_17875 [Blastocatellia bacterium]
MTSADKIVFVIGVITTLMLSGGVLITIREFSAMGQYAERFRPKPGLSGITEEKPGETEATVKKG